MPYLRYTKSASRTVCEYLALPSLLFYWVMNHKNLEGLRILGPAEEVLQVVQRTVEFLQLERFFPALSKPIIIPIEVGNTYDYGDFMHDPDGNA